MNPMNPKMLTARFRPCGWISGCGRRIFNGRRSKPRKTIELGIEIMLHQGNKKIMTNVR
ncbi:MAG: hypothetical protein GPOALKHO_001183 [Sodalis sp.]|nr:MAG: hypothetical protein GPOALKHO_001183 [Sodalis sp.]